MRPRLVGWLLALANADPGCHRRDFYALKDRLLKKYGRVVGEDVQRIVDHCWGDTQQGCEGKSCRRCGGTGFWRDRWFLLERWELGGRTFHRPAGPAKPRAVDYIAGYIRHNPRNLRACREALLWLALLFDCRLFWLALTSSRTHGWHWRPMLALQSVVFRVHIYTRRHQCYCGKMFWTRGSGWQICQACRRALHSREGFDELPF